MERALTREEASRFASALYLNHLEKSARFELHAVLDYDGTQASLVGELSWSTGIGRAMVVTSRPDFTLTEVYWSDSFVLERHPVVDQILNDRGVSSPTYLRRPIDARRRIDNLIQVVASLAAGQPENATLIRQKEGSSFLRSDDLRGEEVDVMRFGWQNIYWVSKQSGLLMRFEGRNSAGQMPIIVDLQTDSNLAIPFPGEPNIIDIKQIPDIWSAINRP